MEPKQVILVNEHDVETGVAEKLHAHKQGLLHRAFSVFIFNSKGEMLLQQRSIDKYHSGGLWTNSCCSHPQPGEDTLHAAQKRLQEEMGFTTSLHKVFDFIYRADFENGLAEHEFDHVFTGEYEGPVNFNENEVMNYSYKTIDNISSLLKEQPQNFTAWFQIAFPRIKAWWNMHYRTQ